MKIPVYIIQEECALYNFKIILKNLLTTRGGMYIMSTKQEEIDKEKTEFAFNRLRDFKRQKLRGRITLYVDAGFVSEVEVLEKN